MGAPGMLIGGIKSLFKGEQKDSITTIDPFHLTSEQSGRIGMLKKILKVIQLISKLRLLTVQKLVALYN
jgi:hypothetical protein